MTDTRRFELGFPRRAAVPTEAEITLFTQELAWMVRSGVPLGRAIDILLAEAQSGPLAAPLRGIRAELRAGSSLAEAMSRQGRIFPETYLRLVSLAESAGTLPMVLSRLYEGRARAARLRQKVGAALIYPAFLVIVAIAAVALIALAVLPQLRAILPDQPMADGSDRAMRRLIALSDWVFAHGPIAALPVLGAGFACAALLRRPSVRVALAEFLRPVPVIGPLLALSRLADLTRTLAMLAEAGLPVDECLRLARHATPSPRLGATLEKMEAALRAGQDITGPLRADPAFPGLLSSLMKVGQETGNLGQSLSQAAAIFEEKTTTALDRALTLLEPALILFISVAVGSLIYLVIGALMSVNDLFL
ncbi:type II secretion system F family protein [Paragemmobacter straminiformis]|uniref:Type II secretion system F family protein n=1 Tax=Paragemmobacter straminiformis TaxID=2045119 RepID=A0A842IAW2_9RHOB|nr:type II secretion system F family protein [Gemmobacter straminiformis]MBC2836543.1 type II secretion system F family protein [Gemmobacter straminiformis]